MDLWTLLITLSGKTLQILGDVVKLIFKTVTRKPRGIGCRVLFKEHDFSPVSASLKNLFRLPERSKQLA